jgi:hypothetical protein
MIISVNHYVVCIEVPPDVQTAVFLTDTNHTYGSFLQTDTLTINKIEMYLGSHLESKAT